MCVLPRRVLAVANQKGGVGKTTTAINLATSLAQRALRVLLVDLDPQGNATTSLGAGGLQGDTYQLFAATSAAAFTPRPTGVDKVWLSAASMDLAGVDLELASDGDRAVRLKQRLGELSKSLFDIVIMDCPPSFGLLTLNALVAADAVLIPLQCEYFALEGLAHLKKTIDLVRKAHNPGLTMLGIVLTMFDKRNRTSSLVADDARAFFGEVVLRTVIPRNIRLSEAPSHGLPIALYDPRSAGGIAYENMAREVVERLNLRAKAHV